MSTALRAAEVLLRRCARTLRWTLPLFNDRRSRQRLDMRWLYETPRNCARACRRQRQHHQYLSDCIPRERLSAARQTRHARASRAIVCSPNYNASGTILRTWSRCAELRIAQAALGERDALTQPGRSRQRLGLCTAESRYRLPNRTARRLRGTVCKTGRTADCWRPGFGSDPAHRANRGIGFVAGI